MKSQTVITLPDLLVDWPFTTSPNPQQNVVADSGAWLESHGAFNKRAQIQFNRCKVGVFPSLAYPAAGPAHFRAACDLINLFFVFDEKTDSGSASQVAEQAAELMNALRYLVYLTPCVPPVNPVFRCPTQVHPAAEGVLGALTRRWE